MTEQRTDLKELQKLDIQIHETKNRIASFDPLFEEVEEPALILERDLNTTKNRLQEMKLEERRLELATEEQRTRQKKLDERLSSVKNLREEAAVSAELDMVKRSLQNNEQEALQLLDQIRKMEERAEELDAAFAEASELVEPKKQELLSNRTAAQEELASLRQDRERFVEQIDDAELKIYDAIRAGGRRVAIAALTEDGACGHCFGMVPLQVQNEIRHGDSLIRCESCGVILTAPDPEAEATEKSAADAASSEDDGAGDDVEGDEVGESDDDSGGDDDDESGSDDVEGDDAEDDSGDEEDDD